MSIIDLTDNPKLEQIIENMKYKIMKVNYVQGRTDNLSYKQRRALTDLTTNPNIVINKADKGSTVVILNKTNYITDGNSHLDNPTVYRPLPKDITPATKLLIQSKLDRMKKAGMLDQDMWKFCQPPSKPRTSILYFLKKIHKQPMGIRPIVSSVNREHLSICRPLATAIGQGTPIIHSGHTQFY